MITVRKPEDKLFNYAEAEELYNSCKEQIRDDDFEDVIKRTDFYSFYITQTGELIGCIYYYKKGRKLFVNCFANRGHHLLNLECMKLTLGWWKCNVYADIADSNRASKIGALRCGFKRMKNNLYVYRRKK